MTITRALHDAVVLTTSPQRIRRENSYVIGSTMQNRDRTASIYLRSGGDGAALSYIELLPLGDSKEDILPPQEELWAYSDVDGTVLTIAEKYRA